MTKLDKLRDIAKRLKEAAGPDRELDLKLCMYGHSILHQGEADAYLMLPVGSKHSPRLYPKHFTLSIDAALVLVERTLPGWRWTVTSDGREEGVPKAWIWLELHFPDDEAKDIPLLRNFYAEAPTAPLAILRAWAEVYATKLAELDRLIEQEKKP